jgi:putative two-component system response regulator
VLLCPGKFGPEEFAVMRRHPEIGGQALAEAVEKLGEESFLSIGSAIAYYHHERWDGTGYPFGLKGEEIPLAARIVALADVYDALTIRRRYKEAYAHEDACGIIAQGRGTHFDPAVVDAFREVQSSFREIRRKFSD